MFLFVVTPYTYLEMGGKGVVLRGGQFLSQLTLTAPQLQRNCLTLKGAFGLCRLLLKCIYFKSDIITIYKIILEISTYMPPLCKRRWHDEVMTEELFFCVK